MGQRTQIIVHLPSHYYNEGNPNNRHPHVKVYHNQWLYGMNFLKYADRLTRSIKKLYTGDNWRIDELVDDCINHANYSDLDYITHSRLYDDEYHQDYEYFNNLLLDKSDLEFLQWFDNNNGYLVVNIDPLQITLVSGTENTEINKIVTPKEYLNLFYSDQEILAAGELEVFQVIKRLNSIPRFKYNQDFNIIRKIYTETLAV